MMRKYPYAPHPFVVTPPLTRKTEFSPFDELSFELTLIGRAADALPHFIYAVEELGRRGLDKPENRFALARVEDASGFAEGHCIYEAGEGKLKDQLRRVDFSDLCDKARAAHRDGALPVVVLKLLTPMHIVTGGKIDHDLKFTSVIQSLLRRIKLLQYFHCLDHAPGSPRDNLPVSQIEENPKPLASGHDNGDSCSSAPRDLTSRPDSASVLTREEISHLLSISDKAETGQRNLRWVGYPRKSGHSGAPMTLRGFVGELEYSLPSMALMAELTPYLRLGEAVHIGSDTGFGQGKIHVCIRQGAVTENCGYLGTK